MRIIKSLVILLFCLIPLSARSQTICDVYQIGKIFSVSIPSTMTIRDPNSIAGKFIDNRIKKFALEYLDYTADWKYTFIPSGENSANKYARIIIYVSRQNNITQKMVKEATMSDLLEVKAARMKEAKQIGMDVKNFSVSKEIYGGKYAVVLRYDRAGLSGDVHVEDYMFYLLNKQIEVTISYRISESRFWKQDFTKIPSTFYFE